MLREAVKAGTSLGLKAKEFMDKGGLVPDEVVIGLVSERLEKSDAKNGFVLDGFPRTPEQGRALDATLKKLNMPLDTVLYFKTSLAVVIRRLSGRRVCGQCGKNYHIVNFRPKTEGICDVCGSKLIQRPDDHEATIEKRLRVYEEQTAPLIDYYKKQGILEEVPGDFEVKELNALMMQLFREKKLIKVSGVKG